jgi:hypothetical protein
MASYCLRGKEPLKLMQKNFDSEAIKGFVRTMSCLTAGVLLPVLVTVLPAKYLHRVGC